MLQNLATRFVRTASVKSVQGVSSVRTMSSRPIERKSIQITEYLAFNQYHPNETGNGTTPTVLFLPWITATPRVAQRFEDLYGHRGFNVLTVWSRMKYFMWPKSALPVAASVMEYMRSEVHGDIIVHGMSIGAYLYALIVMLAMDDKSCHDYFREHIKGNVFDSIVYGGPRRMATGMSKIISENVILEKLVTTSLLTYLSLTREHTQRILDASIKAFENNPFLPSALMMFTTMDRMADPESVEAMAKGWQDRGVHVKMKKWTDSGHAELFKSHPREYVDSLNGYLAFIKPTLERPLKARL